MEILTRYLVSFFLVSIGVACYLSAPGPIIPYLRKKAKNPEDFASGLKIAMTVRRWLGIGVVALGLVVLTGWGTHS